VKIAKTVYAAFVLLIISGLVMSGVGYSTSMASSHREAPLIATDPAADTTDVYAFVSPELSNTVTLVANWIPLQAPYGGPNFHQFDPTVQYEINVDTQGLARANVTFRFEFRTERRSSNTFLYNTGQVTSLNDPDLNVRQFYNVTKIMRTFDANGNFITGTSQVLATNVPVAPANIGPRSTPNYEADLGQPAITNLAGGGKVFAGPRDDPFFVDLGSAFDLLGLRPLNEAHLIPLSNTTGVDGVGGYNVSTTAIQVPKSSLGSTNGVIGVWSASKRQATRVINQFNGNITYSGAWVGVSRLGMPLVNEVVVPLAFKDVFNFSRPDGDGRFLGAVTAPEMVGLINLLYPPVIDAPTTGRDDLVTVFLTGIPGVNQLPIVTGSEMIRLNMNIPPSANPNRLGVTGGDNAGFPNGRRLLDDVVDIELRALACAYGVVNQSAAFGPCTPSYNQFPNNAITDGLDANDRPFTASFPYMAEPWQGYEGGPPYSPDMGGALATGLGFAGAGITLGLMYFYKRRRSPKITDDGRQTTA
jgi:hypothetical protein